MNTESMFRASQSQLEVCQIKMKQYVLAFLAVFLAMLVNVGQAAMGIANYADPDHPGKCVVQANLILSNGQAVGHPTIECVRVACGKNGWATLSTCSPYAVLPGCALGERKFPKAEYPQCCERLILCKPGIRDNLV